MEEVVGRERKSQVLTALRKSDVFSVNASDGGNCKNTPLWFAPIQPAAQPQINNTYFGFHLSYNLISLQIK